MHHRMWDHPATQRNVARLEDGAQLVGPVSGPLASGEEGMGRMAEPEAIADTRGALLTARADLAGRTIPVSAGPTHEPVDPVRFLGSRSSGRMGYPIAERARLERNESFAPALSARSLQLGYGSTVMNEDITLIEHDHDVAPREVEHRRGRTHRVPVHGPGQPPPHGLHSARVGIHCVSL